MSSSVSEDGSNVGTAFGLVTIAGLSTTLGAAFLVIPGLARRATTSLLAGCLSFSAGVMVYVSFVEILSKAVDKFHEAGHAENVSHAYAALCFFIGVAFTIVSSHHSSLLLFA